MASIKRDAVKQKWEDADSTDFPLVCETCLGDNPYIRMTKEPHGKSCKICNNPFTVFAWQAGTKGRLKRVEICNTCARAKNVCQVCIFDLQYGLPVQVRDQILAQEGASKDATSYSMIGSAMPQSDANRAWFNAMNQRSIAQQDQPLQLGNSDISTMDTATLRATAKLQSMARMEPRYQRNLAKLCTFYARGECNRGADCPFRHELPRDRNDPLSKQNTVDRFYGSNDPVAHKMLSVPRKTTSTNRIQQNQSSTATEESSSTAGDERAVATLYVRFDTSTSTNNAHGTIHESDLRDAFYSYGEIVSVRMHANLGAFVEFTTSQATELAILSMNRKTIKGGTCKIFCTWARTPKRGNTSHFTSSLTSNIHSVKGVGVVPAPPPGSRAFHTLVPGSTLAINSASVFTTARSSPLKRPGSDLVPDSKKS